MSEIWAAAAVSVAGSVIAGKAEEKKDKSDKAHDAAMTKEESALAAQRTGYSMALEDFYEQRNRARKQRGLDQYRQFSTMREFAPNYNPNQEVRIEPGEAPQYSDFVDPNAIPQQQQQQQGGGGRSTMDRILDPLGLF